MKMKSVMYFTIFAVILIISCSNLGNQNTSELKTYRGGDAFNTVLNKVLEEDKAFENLLAEYEKQSSYIGNMISSSMWKSRGDQPENFALNYYQSLNREIKSLTDTVAQVELQVKMEQQQASFEAKLEGKREMQDQLYELSQNLVNKINVLKISKTMAYMEEYQNDLDIDLSDIKKDINELSKLLEKAEAMQTK